MAGHYYLDKQGRSPGVPEEELIRIAAVSLGLNDVSPFDPHKKIIEYQFKDVENSLVDLNLREFSNELSMDSPAPGGGSTAALCGALSASLTAMVSNLTVGKKGYEEVQSQVKELAVKAQSLKDELLKAIDLDTLAFNKVMSAGRMPKKTEEQKAEREKAIEAASQEATRVPFQVLETCVAAIQLAKEIVLCGNKNSISDAGVAALSAQTGAEGAYYNVIINLPGILDQTFVADMQTRATAFKTEAASCGDEVRRLVEEHLEASLNGSD
jgi:glutamate formiminotransferase/formiminotetrahydrofolate cyclodeaminase